MTLLDYFQQNTHNLLRKHALFIAMASITSTVYLSPTYAKADVPTAELDPIIITAVRTPTKTSNVIAQTKVLNEQDLQRFQGQTVLEVLAQQSGFSLKQDGGIGSSSNFYLRGYDSKRVLVLIDGIRYGSLSLGQPALGLLPAEQIERIEILYGASGSSIYGSNAMGGVIQIFTKGQSTSTSGLSVTMGAGSNNHYLYGATVQYAGTNGENLSLSASRNQTKGISAVKYATGINSDNDGYESNNFSVSTKIPLSHKVNIGANGLYADSISEFDAYDNVTNAELAQKNGAYSIFADYQGTKLTATAKAGQSIDKLNNKVGDEFTSTQTQVNLVSNYHLPVGQLTQGTELLRQEVEITDNTPSNGTDSFVQDNRTIKSLFLGYQYQDDKESDNQNSDATNGLIDGWGVQVNGRYDDNSQFDNQTVYGLGISKYLTSNLRIGTSYSTGYRAPSLNDLYVESQYYVPNPELEVETSKNAEAFIEYANDVQKTRLTWFDSQAKDMISSQFDASTYKFKAINLDKANISGISISSDWQFENLFLGAGYTNTKALNDSGENKGNFLNNRPEHKGSVYIGYQTDDYNIRFTTQRVGQSYASLDNTEKLDDYTLVNFSGSYYLSPELTFSAQINNLTNEDYSTNDSFGTRYSQDGTNVFASLTYNY